MNILNALINLRNDIKDWVTNNLIALDAKIDNISVSGGGMENIVDDESNELLIVDSNDNAIFRADADGIQTTKLLLNSGDVDEQIEAAKNDLKYHAQDMISHTTTAEKERWNNKSDFSGYFDELKGSPIANAFAEGQIITDKNGNIIVRIDKNGLKTTTITATTYNGDLISVEDIDEIANSIIENNIEVINLTYDGDNESDKHTWIALASGARHLVKVSDVPEKGIDLVGCEISILVPEWPQNNYTVKITQEMCRESNGLTQVLYQNAVANDNVPITLIAVCTETGEYAIECNGWTETLVFSETGIYFIDGRASWEGKYVASMFREKAEPSNDSKENPAEYTGNEIQVFTRGLCIGDSITEGVFNYDGGQTAIKKYSYPSILKRITNIDIVNAGVSGLTTKTWYEASIDSNTQYGRWVNDEWVWNVSPEVDEGDAVSTALNYSDFDFAIIHLGINDIYMMGDATLDATVSTFETNINNIIGKLKTANAGIKVFLCTIIPSYAVQGDTNYAAINEKIREIASATEDVFLIDLNEYSECQEGTPYAHIHLTAIGYQKMAAEIKSLISYTIKENLNKFNMIQFIGTSYTS